MVKLIAVAPPYKVFVPGQGLPDVPKEGVLVTDEQDAAIRAIAEASENPLLVLLGYVYEVTEDPTLASKAYIEERFEALVDDVRMDLADEYFLKTEDIPDANLPDRLSPQATVVSDWNDADENGWYLGTNAANGPSVAYYFGRVEVQSSTAWIRQEVFRFIGGGQVEVHERVKENAEWGAWQRVYRSAPELDARYLNIGEGIQDSMLPARIRNSADYVAGGDWNNATVSGWYASDPVHTNVPPGLENASIMGEVTNHGGWIEQRVWSLYGTSANDTVMFRRTRQADPGTWSAWYRIRQSEAELDARYLNIGEGIQNPMLPGRLQENSELTTDWNAADRNGWFASDPGCLNTPEGAGASSGYWFGQTSQRFNWTYQTVWSLVESAAADTKAYRRKRNASTGIWEPWYRIRLSEAELDARYTRRPAANPAGSLFYNGDMQSWNNDTGRPYMWNVDAGSIVFGRLGTEGSEYRVLTATPTAGANMFNAGPDGNIPVLAGEVLSLSGAISSVGGGHRYRFIAHHYQDSGAYINLTASEWITTANTSTSFPTPAHTTLQIDPAANSVAFVRLGIQFESAVEYVITNVRGDRMPMAFYSSVPPANNDWNNAVLGGTYSGYQAANSPSGLANGWLVVRVEQLQNNPQYVTQHAHEHAIGSGNGHKSWRRVRDGGTWSSWVRVYDTEAELDGRFWSPRQAGTSLVQSNTSLMKDPNNPSSLSPGWSNASFDGGSAEGGTTGAPGANGRAIILSTGPNGSGHGIAASDMFAVSQSQRLRISAELWTSGTTAPSFFLRFDWYDSAKTFISYADVVISYGNGTIPNTANPPEFFKSSEATPPSGAAYAVAQIINIPSYNGSPVYLVVANPRVDRVTGDEVPDRLSGNYGGTAQHLETFGNDWNLATETGWYMSDAATNAPGAGWYLGQVIAHNTSWVTQEVWAFTDPNPSNVRFRRHCNNGVWGAWQHISAFTDKGTLLNVDFNSVLNVGAYRVLSSGSWSGFANNPPTGVHPYGTLTVFIAGNYENCVTQMYVPHLVTNNGLPALWVRSKYNASDWTPWVSAANGNDSGWINLPFSNGWFDYNDATWGRIQYRKIGNRVTLRGLVNGSSHTGDVFTTLPDGARPLKPVIAPAVAADVGRSVTIETDGNIGYYGPDSPVWLSLNGISFLTD